MGVVAVAIILLCLLCVANTLCRRGGKRGPLRMPGKKESLLGDDGVRCRVLQRVFGRTQSTAPVPLAHVVVARAPQSEYKAMPGIADDEDGAGAYRQPPHTPSKSSIPPPGETTPLVHARQGPATSGAIGAEPSRGTLRDSDVDEDDVDVGV